MVQLITMRAPSGSYYKVVASVVVSMMIKHKYVIVIQGI